MMQTSELQDRLNRLGMDAGVVDGVMGPATRTATARFQLACALPGHNLVVDAVPGPRTWAALVEAGDRGGRLSPHFTVAELRTRTRSGGPKDGTCWVHRDLLHRLEELRAAVGQPLGVISGWRDVAHNRRVGGAGSSQHTFGVAPELVEIGPRLRRGSHLRAGRAADFNRGYIRLDECRDLLLFGGIGHRDGWVTHVDVRPQDPRRPAVWRY
jgi:zinc D-Ala-D-Ala carboxypeptidase